MAEVMLSDKAKQIPQAVHLSDYKVPAYLIDEIDLIFDLQEEFTLVHSHMRIRRNRLSDDKSNVLHLNGEALTLESIKLNHNVLSGSQYTLTDTSLTLKDLPENFELEITTKIYPQDNTELSGLYRSAKTYCTQCESEGFRRITYFVDRPDVLSRYTTTIYADAVRYPYLLSNGNLVGSGKLEDGRHWAKWEDPYKKPCYLFALVAGDFDVIEDTFTTGSKREVALRLFVEKGYRDQVPHALYSLKEAMQWDEKTYGREYDLDVLYGGRHLRF